MATIWIEQPCDLPEDLPDVCARCGTETTNRVKRTFNWVPPWVIITILIAVPVYIILAIVMRKDCKMSVPMCKKHKGHWFGRGLLTFLTFFLFIGGVIGLMILTMNVVPKDSEAIGILWILAGIVGWLIFIVVANQTAIRANEITDNRIRLTNINADFARAYNDLMDERDRNRRSRSRGARERWEDRGQDDRRDDRDRDRRPAREGGERFSEDDRPRRDREDDRPRRDREDDRPRRDREDDRTRRDRPREDDY